MMGSIILLQISYVLYILMKEYEKPLKSLQFEPPYSYWIRVGYS